MSAVRARRCGGCWAAAAATGRSPATATRATSSTRSRERDVEHMFGCFMSARREAAAAVRFDENLPGYALAEDEDFSYRLSRLGRIRYLPDVVVNHRKLGLSSQETREFGRLVVTNRAYIFRKNFPQTRLARMQFALFLSRLRRAPARQPGMARSARADRRRGRPDPDAAMTQPGSPSSPPHARRGGAERYLRLLLRELGPEWRRGVVCLEDGPLVERPARRRARAPRARCRVDARRDLAGAGVRLGKLASAARAPTLVHANGVKAAVAAPRPRRSRPPLVWVKHDFTWDGVVAAAVALPLPAGRSRSARRWQRPSAGAARAGCASSTTDCPADRGRPVSRPADPARRAGRAGVESGDRRSSAGSIATRARRSSPPFCPRSFDAGPGHCGSHSSAPTTRPDRSTSGTLRQRLARDGVADDVVSFLGYREDAVELHERLRRRRRPERRGRGRAAAARVSATSGSRRSPSARRWSATRTERCRETLGDCALLVPPGDRAALGDAIRGVLEDAGVRERLVECGRERVEGRFSLERMVAGMKDEYRRAAKPA